MRKIYLFDVSSLGHGKDHKAVFSIKFCKGKGAVGSLNYPSCSDKPIPLLCGDTMWNERFGHLIEMWQSPVNLLSEHIGQLKCPLKEIVREFPMVSGRSSRW